MKSIKYIFIAILLFEASYALSQSFYYSQTKEWVYPSYSST